MSQTLSPKQVANEWFERLWNKRDESAINELMAPDAKGMLEGGTEFVGPEEFRGFYRTLVTVFPDVSIELRDVIEEGEKACVIWAAKGTHKGEGLGLQPTGQPHTFAGITWLRVVDGKIVNGGDHWDLGGLMGRMAAAAPK